MSSAGNKFVMVVDDEADICSVVKKSLDSSGFKVSTFTNPTLALEHFKQDPDKYGIIVTDVRMPGMGGFELVRRIKSLNPDVKVVLMTAFEINQSEFQKVMPNSAIEAFVKKPISPQGIKQVLEKLPSRQRAP
jgi:DNA-binding NtrC family response regulator